MLEKEFKFYKENQEELLTKYSGMTLVIKGEEVVGVYDNDVLAYEESVAKYELGTFLIQACIPQEEAAHFFYSRVLFNGG